MPTDIQLGRILQLEEQGMSQREISLKLAIPQSTISTVLAKYRLYGTLIHLCGNGRPRVVSREIMSTIRRNLSENPRTSLRKMVPVVQEKHGLAVSRTTIKRALNDEEIF